MKTLGKRWLLVCRRPPYGHALAREAIDVALAAAAFDQPVSLLFTGDGVLQLLEGQSGAIPGQSALGLLLSSLPLYDIDEILVDAQALFDRGLTAEALVVPVKLLSAEAMTEVVHSHDVVLSA